MGAGVDTGADITGDRMSGGRRPRPLVSVPGVSTPPPDWLPMTQAGPLDDKLGIRIVDFRPHRLVATMPVDGNQQPFGLLHGGATCALVESVGSWAAAINAGPGTKAVGVELNASYLRAATSGTVTAVCTPARTGRTRLPSRRRR